jgi:hypothetical protein
MQVPAPIAAQLEPIHLQDHRLRAATADDIAAMADLEMELCHIRREKDYAFFIRNDQRIWRTIVAEAASGQIDAVLASVAHPGSTMLGPGVMRSDNLAAALITDHLLHHARADRAPVFLIPLDRPALQQQMYALSAKNLEIHFAQSRGPITPHTGVTMPTFMPETA